jgi:hypothetical protein
MSLYDNAGKINYLVAWWIKKIVLEKDIIKNLF